MSQGARPAEPAKCGSPRKNGRPPCGMPAGSRTNHPGVGRCFLHGGNIPAGPENANWRHGLYARVFRGEQAKKFKHTSQESDPLQVAGELAVARTLFASCIEHLEDQERPSKEEAGILQAWLGQINALVGRNVDVRTSDAVTRADLLRIQIVMERLIRDFIPDPERQRAFVERLRAGLGKFERGGEDTDAGQELALVGRGEEETVP